jgi:hypothetical protein
MIQSGFTSPPADKIIKALFLKDKKRTKICKERKFNHITMSVQGDGYSSNALCALN